MTTWRYYDIGPLRGGLSRIFYAPSIQWAFHLARLQWGSRTLTCYGSKR